MSRESMRELHTMLMDAVLAVERGEKNEEACATIVAPKDAMKGSGIRPHLAAVSANGDRIYLLNVRQAQKLADRIEEALDAQDTMSSQDTTKGNE